MLDLGSIKIGVDVDDKEATEKLGDLKDKVEDSAPDEAQNSKWLKWGGTLKKVALAGAVAFGALVAKVTKDSLEVFKTYEQLEGGAEKIFGSATQQVLADASNAWKDVQMSANDYLQLVTSTSGGLSRVFKDDEQAMAEYAKKTAEIVADQASVYGQSTQEVSDTLASIQKGNYQVLDNMFGGMFKGSKKGMEDLMSEAEKILGRDLDMDNWADVLDAIKAVQEEYDIAGNSAEEASHTIEGSVNMMKSAWSNFLVELGKGDGDIDGAMNDLLSSISTVAKNVVPVAGEIVKNLVMGIINNLPKMVSQLTDGIRNFLQSAIDSDATENAGKGIAENIIKGVVILVEKLPEIIILAIQLALETAGALAGNLMMGVVNTIVKAWNTLKKKIKVLKLNIDKKLVDLAKKAIDAVKDAWQKLKSIAGNIKLGIKTAFGDVVEKLKKIKDWWGDLVNGKKSTTLTVNEKTNKSGGGKAGGRIGITKVPYDDYEMKLHKGEVVLTAAETHQYEKYLAGLEKSSKLGGQTVNINFSGNYNFRNKDDINYFMKESARLVRRQEGVM